MPANGEIINLSLNMTANTQQAKKDLQELQTILSNLSSATVTNNSIGGTLNKDLTNAVGAANQLKMALQSATNVKTGQLDLGKLSTSLKESGMNLEQYRQQFNKLGPEGTTAFNQVATSITQAAGPMKQSNALLEGMWTNLKKVASWQISSSILHGFMSSVSNAYKYVQDLNKSLNNIQIVTQKSNAEMAKFAQQANKSAKELSTTTTAYTDAALIFYQQGLDGKDVTDRTDVVMKMANVTKQSAEEVASQMTAIWNNFDNGSESMEHYADVITNLGAHTASSSKEISEGLGKFASIGKTVGLSYEYATTALATVVDKTRQSADTVGTAFKTIFARLEGLNLGKTLDDGTTLNKYSEALAKVGVNIKEADGQLRDMDEVLYDLGGKWQTLEKDQKMALAQTVAGTRQYTQLIALMDNWQDFQSNLAYANDAEGTLNTQQETYAEGWEGASKRVQAAAEGMYQALLDDDFFIGITNFTGGLIDGFTKVVKAAGGLPTLLMTIIPLINRMFGPQIAKSIDDTVTSLRRYTKSYKEQAEQTRQQGFDILRANISEANKSNENAGGAVLTEGLTNQLGLQREFLSLNDNLTDKQKQQVQLFMDLYNIQLDIIKKKKEEVELNEEEIKSSAEKIKNSDAIKGVANQDRGWKEDLTEEVVSKSDKISKTTTDASLTGQFLDMQEKGFNSAEQRLEAYIEKMKSLRGAINEAENGFEEFLGTASQTEILSQAIDQTEQKMKALESLKNFDKDEFMVDGELDRKAIADKYGETAAYGEVTTVGADGKEVTQKIIDDSGEIAATAQTLQAELENVIRQTSDDASNACDEAKSDFEDTTNNIVTGIKNASKNIQSDLGKMLSNAKKQKVKINVDEAKAKIQELENKYEIAKGPKAYQRAVEKAMNALEVEGADAGKVLQTLQNDIRKAGNQLEDEFTEAAGGIANTAQETGELNGEIINIGAGAQNTGEKIKQSFDGEKVYSFGQKMTAVTSAVSSVGSAISGVKGIIDTWNNQDLSVGERIITTMTTLGMVVGSVSAAFTGQTGEILANTGAKWLNALASGGQTAAEVAETTAKDASTKATWLQTAANWALNTSLGPILIVILAITAAIVALVAIVWLIVAAFDAWRKSTPEYQLEQTKKASVALDEALEKTKQEAENLKKTLENYDTAIDKLISCVKYSKDWYTALAEVNNQTLQLLQKYPELKEKGFIKTDEKTGAQIITEEGQEYITNKENEKVSDMQAAKASADNKIKNEEAKQTLTDSSHTFNFVKSSPFMSNDNDTNKDLFETFGEEDVKKLINADSRELTIQNMATELEKRRDEDLEAWRKRLEDQNIHEGDSSWTAYNAAEDRWNEEIKKFKDSVQTDDTYWNAIKQYGTGQKETDDATKEALRQKLVDNENVNSENAGEIANILSKSYTDTVDETVETLKNQGDDDKKKNAKKWLEAQGIEVGEITEVSDEKLKYKAKGSDEETEVEGGTQAALYYAAQNNSNVVSQLETSAKAVDSVLKRLQADTTTTKDKDGNEIETQNSTAKGIETFIKNKSFEGLNGEDFENFTTGIQAMNKDDAAKLYGLDEDTLKTLGYDNWEKFQEGVETARKNYHEQQVNNTDIAETYGIDQKAADKLSLEQAKNFDEKFKQMSDQEGKDTLAQTYNEVFKELEASGQATQENIDKVAAAFNNVDFSKWDAGDQLKNQLDSLGLSIDTTAINWEKLDHDFRQSNASTPVSEFENLQSQIEKVNEATAGLQIGDEINTKKYEELIALNGDLADNFSKTKDGKFKLIDDNFGTDAIAKMSDTISKMKEMKADYNKMMKDDSIDTNTFETYGKVDAKNTTGETAQKMTSDFFALTENKEYTGLIQSLGYTQEEIDKIADERNIEKISTFYEKLNQAIKDGNEGKYDTSVVTEQMKAQVKDLEDLNASADAFNKEQTGDILDSMMVNQAENFGLASDAIKDYASSLQRSGKSNKEVSKDLVKNADEAKKVALANTAMNQGLKDLRKNFDNYSKQLKSSNKNSVEYRQALQGIRKDMSKVLNVDTKALSDSFFTSAQNLELMEKATKGNVEAIEELRKKAAKDIVAQVTAELDPNTTKKVENLHNKIQNWLSSRDFKIGTKIDTKSFIKQCNEMLATAKMTKDQAANYFQAMGFNAKITKQPVKSEVINDITTGVASGEKGVKSGKGIKKTTRREKIVSTSYVAAVETITANGSAGGTISFDNTAEGQSSNNSGGSGGSGGSDSGSKSKEDKKDLNDELERYHVINKQIDAQTKKLELLSSAKDRAYGKDRLKIMDQEIAAQKKFLKLEEKKTKEINKNVKKDAGFMKGYGANIGKDGTITNYREIMKKQVDKYNAAVKKYNNSSQSDADKNALEAAKKNYETFKNHLENYEDSIEKSQDQAAKIAEEKAKLLQLKLAKIDYKLEIRVELDDRKLAKLEKQLSRLQNSNFSQAKQVTNINKQANVLMDEADATRSAMRSTIQAGTKKKLSKNQINKIMNGEMSNKQLKKLGMSNDTIEQLKKYRDSLDDINDKLYDLKLQIPDTVNSFMNEYLSKMDEGIQKIEHQKQLWQNIQNITDLINPSLNPKQRLSKQDKIEGQRTTITNAQANVSAKKAYEDTAHQEYEQYQKAYNDAKKADKNMSAEEKKKWEDSLKEREKAWKDAELATQQATIDALTAIQEAWKQIAAAIIEDGKKAADEAASQYSRIKEERDLYYKDYQRMYETSKLMRQINQSKDKTNNLKSQQAYNNLLEEVAQYQKDGAEMSKYDIEYLQKKYALTEAQIALEEARDAKSQVSLSRDAEGNMGYVYTADTSKVASAEQNYEDKLYALQDFVQKSTDELANSWVQAEQKMYQEIEAINNDMTLSEEQKVAKLTEIANHYDLVRKYYAGELDNLMEHGKEVNSDFVGYNGEQNDYLAEGIRDTIFNEIYPDLEEGINNFDDLYENHSTYLHETIMPELKDALSQYGEDIRTTATNGGIDVKQFKKEYKNMADTVVKKSGEAADSVEEMKKKQKTEYDKVKKEVDAWYKNVKNNVNKCIKKNEKAADSVDKITTAYGKAKKAASDATKQFNNAATAAQKAAAASAKAAQAAATPASAKAAQAAAAAASANNNNNNSGDGTDDGSSDKTKYVKITARVHGFEGTYYVVSSQWSNGKIKKGTKASEVLNSVGGDINFPVSDIESPKKVDGPKTKDKFGFASGGYTGEWGSKDGKLAFLHEKELVLNKDDTENMLKMIEIVRKYNKEIQTLREAENIAKYKGELKIINQQIQAFEEINSKLKSLTAGIQLASASIKAEKKNEDLLQKVEIKAEFPSVRDRTEIEEAFENLVNKAAQFANQKTR